MCEKETAILLGRRYHCRSCDTHFNSYDADVRAQLPQYMWLDFPFVQTGDGDNALFVEESIVESVAYLDSKGVSFAAIEHFYVERRHEQHLRERERWLALTLAVQQDTAACSQFAHGDGGQRYVPKANDFPGVEKCVWAYFPGSQVLIDLFTQHVKLQEEIMIKSMQMKDIQLLKLDDTFKSTSRIHDVAARLGGSVVYSLTTIMNGLGQIVQWIYRTTPSHRELRPFLEDLQERQVKRGTRPCEVVYTDNPMADRRVFEECFPSLKPDEKDDRVVPSGSGSVLPLKTLSLPAQFEPKVVYTDVALVATMDGLKERLREVCDHQVVHAGNDKLYVSLDAEWTVHGKGEAQAPVEVLQLGMPGVKNNVIIISLAQILSKSGYTTKGKSVSPAGKAGLSALLGFLTDPEIVFVGVNIKADITRLLGDINYPALADMNLLDLRSLAVQYHIVHDTSITLASLVEYQLGVRLDKPDSIRLHSSWRGQLLPAQVNYASLDVLAALSLYESFQRQVPPQVYCASSLPLLNTPY